MTTPKERAHLLDLLNRTVDWPLVTVVDAIAEVIEAEFKAQAEEFRRLAAEAVENREKFRETQESYLVTFYNGMRVAYQRAAQMLEEKLNG